MDDLYREQILEHYKRPHNFGELETADLEFEDNNPLCGDELKVQLVLDDDRRISRGRVQRARLRDLAGVGVAVSDEIKGMPVDDLLKPRQVVRARAARDRHLGDAHEVRAAVAEGAEGRVARRRRADWDDAAYAPGGARGPAGL